MPTPMTQVTLLSTGGSTHWCAVNTAASASHSTSTLGLPSICTNPVINAVCGWSFCSIARAPCEMRGTFGASKYLKPRKSISRKLTSSSAARMWRDASNDDAPANPSAQYTASMTIAPAPMSVARQKPRCAPSLMMLRLMGPTGML